MGPSIGVSACSCRLSALSVKADWVIMSNEDYQIDTVLETINIFEIKLYAGDYR